jgi:YHS domain-containing protein
MNVLPRLSIRLFAVLCAASSLTVLAAEPVSKSRLGGVAIGGHDTVAYHEVNTNVDVQESAVEGTKTYSVEFKGAKWRFASKESSELFTADPDKYSPAYNGHCANALSLGEGLIRTDGTHWEIFEDKLYLFYAARGRDRWTDGNWKTYKVDADAAWATLSK